MKVCPGRTKYGSAMSLDVERQDWRVPVDLFHSPDQLVSSHFVFVVAIELAPSFHKKSFDLGGVGNLVGSKAVKNRPQRADSVVGRNYFAFDRCFFRGDFFSGAKHRSVHSASSKS